MQPVQLATLPGPQFGLPAAEVEGEPAVSRAGVGQRVVLTQGRPGEAAAVGHCLQVPAQVTQTDQTGVCGMGD